MSKKEIYKWNSDKTDKENIENKLAQMRELIWEKFPDNQGEMIGDPFSVLVYYEKYTKTLASQLEEIKPLLINAHGLSAELLEKLEMLTRCESKESIIKMRCIESPMDKRNWCQGCKNKQLEAGE